MRLMQGGKVIRAALATALIAAAPWTRAWEPTPPGQVLRDTCAKVSLPGNGERDLRDRAYCLRFIEGAIQQERWSQMERDRRRQAALDRGETVVAEALREQPSFCMPHLTEAGVRMTTVAEVAKGLVEYLGKVPKAELEEAWPKDDPQMRLLMGYMVKTYPCQGKTRP